MRLNRGFVSALLRIRLRSAPTEVVARAHRLSALRHPLYRYEHGHWRLRKSTTAKVSTVLTFSKYSDSTSVPYAGKWRVRARHKVGSKYRYSGYRTFTAS